MKIHFTGGSGSGVSTLGKALSQAIGIPCFDGDDFYWEQTEIPFTIKADALKRNEALFGKPRHIKWLSGLACKVLKVDGSRPVEIIVKEVIKQLS